eukprot:350224-Chlamydomonas_euryale.AAC.1
MKQHMYLLPNCTHARIHSASEAGSLVRTTRVEAVGRARRGRPRPAAKTSVLCARTTHPRVCSRVNSRTCRP